MSELNDPMMNFKIHQTQFDLLYSILLDTLFEGDAKKYVDLLYRTIRVPFRNREGQLAIILLDKRRQGVITAFYVKILAGGNFQKIESIPLDLNQNGNVLSELFKEKSSDFSQAVEKAKSILESKFGPLWTLIVVDFVQISKLYTVLNFEPSKELIGKVMKRVLDRVRDGKIKLVPIPEVVNALEKIIQ